NMANLKLVKPGMKPKLVPARKLGREGQDLWNRIMSEYDVKDAHGIEKLTAACEALDRATALKSEIEKSGYMIESKGGLRENPLIRNELQARAFSQRTLDRMGLGATHKAPALNRRPPTITWEDLQNDEDT